jgi:carbon monoxide dehydrogenase subunit G
VFPAGEVDGRLDAVVDVVAEPDQLRMALPVVDGFHRDDGERTGEELLVELGQVSRLEWCPLDHAITRSASRTRAPGS